MPDQPLRILAVGAHPDDVEFGCGGVLLVEAARDSEIVLCVCSRGEAGTNGTPEERETEARNAATLIGAEIEFLHMGGDARMVASFENVLALARRIRAVQPAIVLATTTTPEQHPDHAAVGQICRDAVRLARYGGLADLRELPPHTVSQLFGYAVTPSAELHQRAIRVDISAQFERWVQLMECHQTQLRTRRYIDLQVARARTFGIEAGVEYAQVLFTDSDFLVGGLSELPRTLSGLF
ncbi:bacillithiol biosynthesis deacetylase BshB1 [soil metagenome]